MKDHIKVSSGFSQHLLIKHKTTVVLSSEHFNTVRFLSIAFMAKKKNVHRNAIDRQKEKHTTMTKIQVSLNKQGK